jgi:hypothetical protein
MGKIDSGDFATLPDGVRDVLDQEMDGDAT